MTKHQPQLMMILLAILLLVTLNVARLHYISANIKALLFQASTSYGATKNNITFLTVTPNDPASAWNGGEATAFAMQIAANDINKRDDILAGYQLNLVNIDSKCNGGYATTQVAEYVPLYILKGNI